MFPVQTADDVVTAQEESLQALPACIRAMVSEAIRQGAATTLVVAQLQFGAAVKVLCNTLGVKNAFNLDIA